MTRTKQSRQKQSTRDAIAHVRNQFNYVESAHHALTSGGGLKRWGPELKLKENELWVKASGAFNQCELDEIEACDALSSAWRKQLTNALFACQQYIDEFHSRAVLSSLTT